MPGRCSLVSQREISIYFGNCKGLVSAYGLLKRIVWVGCTRCVTSFGGGGGGIFGVVN